MMCTTSASDMSRKIRRRGSSGSGSIADNMVLNRFDEKEFASKGVRNSKAVNNRLELVEDYDVAPSIETTAQSCPVATSRRSSLPVNWLPTRACSSPPNPLVEWMSAPSSSFTRRSSRPEMVALGSAVISAELDSDGVIGSNPGDV